MKIDKSKQYTTRDGREVRIYATDGGGHYPVHGAFKASDGGWIKEDWTSCGEVNKDSTARAYLDLIEKKMTAEEWWWNLPSIGSPSEHSEGLVFKYMEEYADYKYRNDEMD